MEAHEHKISVLIPTCNGEVTIGGLLSKLAQQTLQADEIIVFDSDSEDATRALVSKWNLEIQTIDRGQFDHAGTRTAMCHQAKNEILVFFTQDAIPVSNYALEHLIAGLMQSPEIAVAYGRQLPNPAATGAAQHLRDFNYPSQSNVRRFSDRNHYGFTTIFASNSFAAYKKSALAEVGYFGSNLIFGEDTCTVGRLLKKGYSVAYVSEAEVFHSHNYSCMEEFRRSFDIGVFHTLENWLLSSYGSPQGRGKAYLLSELQSLFGEHRYMELVEFILRSAMKIFGYTCGRHHTVLPKKLCPLLSMNRRWWRRSSFPSTKSII